MAKSKEVIIQEQMSDFLNKINNIRKQYVKTDCSIQKITLEKNTREGASIEYWNVESLRTARTFHNDSINLIKKNFSELFPNLDLKKIDFDDFII